jgi:hypothetical protein
MSRSVSDPEASTPVVKSFSQENVIEVYWDSDPLADEYILYRALDGAVLNYSQVYRGTDCHYSDSNGDEFDCYHYSLAKVRGDKIFPMSPSASGVLSLTMEDVYEDNDEKDKATLLTSSVIANIYGFRDLQMGILADEDWYSVIIPAKRTAYIILEQLSPSPSDGINTHFDMYVEGQPSEPVVNYSGPTISNTFDEEKKFRFKIFPNKGKFYPGLSAGGVIVSYKLFLEKIQ